MSSQGNEAHDQLEEGAGITGQGSSTKKKSSSGRERVNLLNSQPKQRLVVVDTCVLLADPEALYHFEGDDVVIPLTVIEELDGQKSRLDDLGRSARAVVRHLENLRIQAGGDLTGGVQLSHGGSVRIVINGVKLDEIRRLGLSVEKNDNRILGTALGLQADGRDVALVSIDVNMRIKAASLGLKTSDWVRGRRRSSEDRPGWREIEVASDILDRFHSERRVPLAELGDDSHLIMPNEFLVMKAGKQSGLARRTGSQIVHLNRQQPWGLQSRSKEQAFALDLLMDPEIPLVGLSGSAGTGKTITALAAALAQVFEPETARYDRLTIIRPIHAVGHQDIGYLPGTVEEKIGPWFESLVDTMVALGDRVTHAQAARNLDAWVTQGKLTMQPVTFLRGRSLQRNLVLTDEAQNLEAPLTLKTILTRIGEGSKLVMLGDTSQIDNAYAGAETNALSVLVDRFSGQDLFGHVTLTKGERSELATLASELL